MNKYPFVAFACNDERGNPTGRVSAIDVEDIIHLSGDASFREDLHSLCVVINDEWLPLQTSLTRYVGNICWNGARVHPMRVAVLLEALRRMGGWEPDSGLCEMWILWDSDTPIEEGHIRQAMQPVDTNP